MDAIKIKELRKIHGIRQCDLAEALNISQQSISRYENGQHYPDMPVLIAIADHFNVPLDYLVGRKWPNGPIPDLYTDEAMSGDGGNADTLTDRDASAEDLIKADMMHILSISKASEALSQESLDLSRLSPEYAAHIREIYNTMLSLSNNKTK